MNPAPQQYHSNLASTTVATTESSMKSVPTIDILNTLPTTNTTTIQFFCKKSALNIKLLSTLPATNISSTDI